MSSGVCIGQEIYSYLQSPSVYAGGFYTVFPKACNVYLFGFDLYLMFLRFIYFLTYCGCAVSSLLLGLFSQVSAGCPSLRCLGSLVGCPLSRCLGSLEAALPCGAWLLAASLPSSRCLGSSRPSPSLWCLGFAAAASLAAAQALGTWASVQWRRGL